MALRFVPPLLEQLGRRDFVSNFSASINADPVFRSPNAPVRRAASLRGDEGERHRNFSTRASTATSPNSFLRPMHRYGMPSSRPYVGADTQQFVFSEAPKHRLRGDRATIQDRPLIHRLAPVMDARRPRLGVVGYTASRSSIFSSPYRAISRATP